MARPAAAMTTNERRVPGHNDDQQGDYCFVADKDEVDESTMALVDTACTRCMHGQFWRENFEKQCLDKHGLKVEFLQSERDFTSAFGHKKRGVQVRIPVSFGGHRGEVVSTEMPDCSTPLLLSLSAQVALDAVFHAKARLWELRSLGVTLPLHPMGGHLGVRVDDFEESETDKRGRSERPGNVSEKGDLSVFLAAAEAPDESFELVFSKEADEAPRDEVCNSADRGILVADSRGIIKHGQRKRLDKACQLLKAADRRDWYALRQVRPAAERFCTANYQTTVIFEPLIWWRVRRDQVRGEAVRLEQLAAVGYQAPRGLRLDHGRRQTLAVRGAGQTLAVSHDLGLPLHSLVHHE